jgi:hypothetical protein
MSGKIHLKGSGRALRIFMLPTVTDRYKEIPKTVSGNFQEILCKNPNGIQVAPAS